MTSQTLMVLRSIAFLFADLLVNILVIAVNVNLYKATPHYVSVQLIPYRTRHKIPEFLPSFTKFVNSVVNRNFY